MCGSEGECIHGLFGFEALYRAYLECRRTKRNTINALKFEADIVERLFAVLSDYVAHFVRADASGLLKSLPTNNGFLAMYFDIAFAAPPDRGVTVARRYPIRQAATTLKAQVQGIRHLRRDECLFVRVGAYYELYNDDAGPTLGLKTLRQRRGFRRRSGFPVRALNQYLRRALSLGRCVAVVEEEPERIGTIKTRQWQWTIVPHGTV